MSPGSLDTRPVPRDAPQDLFRTPPPSDAPPSDAGVEPLPRATTEDIDFLLGLDGSSRTAAALVSPALPTFDDASESEPATPRNDARPLLAPIAPIADEPLEAAVGSSPMPGPPMSRIESTTSELPTRKRWWPSVLLAAGSIGVVGIAVLFARGFQIEEGPIRGQIGTAAAPSEAPPAHAVTPLEFPATAESPTTKEPVPAHSRATTTQPTPQSKSRPSDRVPPRPAKTEIPAPEVAEPSPAPTRHSPPEESAEALVTEPFNRAAAAAALSKAVEEASACKQAGNPSGTTSATVTFAPSGRVTTATLSGPPFAGTKTGSCIAASLRRARVPAFAGEKVTVGKTVVIR